MTIATFLRNAAKTVALTAIAAGIAHAYTPPQKSQAPGYYRMMLGAFEITVLSDGSGPLPVDKLLDHATPAQITSGLDKSFLRTPVETSDNAFLINTGSKLVLIDAGSGALLGPSFGRLVANITAAGYRPDQIDEIYLTHMHGDHVGGLLSEGKPTFKNAVVRAARSEADFWLSQAHMDAAPPAMKGFFQGAMSAIGPYAASGRFKTFDGDADLVPGVRAIRASGHTPGHTVFRIESDGQTLMVLGDLVHVAALQFNNPSITIRLDVDPRSALVQRKKFFAQASVERDWIAGAHLSFPGIGHLRASGSGFIFVPANYQSVP